MALYRVVIMTNEREILTRIENTCEYIKRYLNISLCIKKRAHGYVIQYMDDTWEDISRGMTLQAAEEKIFGISNLCLVANKIHKKVVQNND